LARGKEERREEGEKEGFGYWGLCLTFLLGTTAKWNCSTSVNKKANSK